MAELGIEDFDVLNTPTSACKSCKFFKQHGKACWYYWENKKQCSQHLQN